MTTDGNFASLTVLIVDDDIMSRQLLTTILGKLGVPTVLQATDGAQALEIMETTRDKIDLVVADIAMPELDGWGLARRIRYGAVPRFKNTPIFMLTGHDSDANHRKAQIHKINGFLVKPPSVDRLAQLMGEHLG